MATNSVGVGESDTIAIVDSVHMNFLMRLKL